MKTKVNTKTDGKQFERFDRLLREVISVPKDEILRREKQEKERKEKAKQC